MLALSKASNSSLVQSGRTIIGYHGVGVAMAATDVVVLVGAACIATLSYQSFIIGQPVDILGQAGMGLAFALIFVPISKAQGDYKLACIADRRGSTARLLRSWVVVAGMLLAAVFLAKVGASVSRGFAAIFSAISLVLLAGNRSLWRRYVVSAMAKGTLAGRRVGVITDGSNFALGHLSQRLRESGFEVVRRLDLSSASVRGRQSVAEIAAEAKVQFRGGGIDELFISTSWRRLPFAMRLSEELRVLPLPVRLVVDPVTSSVASQPAEVLGGLMTVAMRVAPLTPAQLAAKRAIDMTVAFVGLFALAPLLLLIAAAIRLESRGPVLFFQTRHGYNMAPFRILKFRTMRVMDDGDVVRQASKNDARITRVGAILRRTSLDELPQLWNVLRGDMALVGPRPHAAAHDRFYEEVLDNYSLRQHVKPGMTGWAQINGCRGETPTIESMNRRVDLDLWYVSNRSTRLDLRILLGTVTHLLRPINAH
jgi:putative colanic acid biosynthesis UDP-glucose lipid carrier transferase